MTTRGYLEGYYGRLLDWPERRAILDTLAELGMNAYAYAPKEDARHRLHWRESYDPAWREAFGAFCREATARGVSVVAGLAPGIDFDFAALADPSSEGSSSEGSETARAARSGRTGTERTDLDAARDKLALLREDGATRLMLLMDDIDPDFERRSGGLPSEGEAHARLANRLGEALDASLIVVPRIYARELAADAPDYLPDFARALDARHAVSVCGRDVVSRTVHPDDCALPGDAPGREIILWDNLYANDYCPRRLFVGPWSGRGGIDDVLLNATGHPETDKLQLALMAVGEDEEAARAVLAAHGVPPAFERVSEAFRHPATNDRIDAPLPALAASEAVIAALDELQWRWKTPLSREWYPHLMGLRQDLLFAHGKLPPDRIVKTQTPPLARALSG